MNQYFKSLIMMIAGILAGVSIVEIGVRLIFEREELRDFNEPPPIFNTELAKGYYEPEPVLGYRPTDQYLESISGRFGFQNGSEYGDKLTDKKKIVVLGDSVIASKFTQYSLRFFLDEYGMEVWNIGVGGYNTRQEAIYLEKYAKVPPDVLVLGLCLNDHAPSMAIVPNEEGNQKFATPLFEPLAEANPILFRFSAIYRHYLKTKVQLFSAREIFWPTGVQRFHKVNVEDGLAQLKAYAEKRKIPFLVIVFPHLNEYSELLWLPVAHDMTIDSLNRLNIDYVDLHDRFQEIGFKNLHIWPEDNVHPNLLGHFEASKMLLLKHPDRFGISPAQAEKISRAEFRELAGSKYAEAGN